MDTIKKGSKGDVVRKLQQALGMAQDGIFGPGTEKAVKAFQAKHGLTADGIVGSGTWRALGVTDTKAVDPSVVYLPISKNIVKKEGREIRYLVIHYTAGASSAAGKARGEYNVFQNGGASADFAVDDGEMVQLNPDPKQYFCYAVGGTKYANTRGGMLYGTAKNANCISIEVLSTLGKGWHAKYANHAGWSFTDAALENARRLARILMQRYNIPLSRVIRHYDVTGKLCPGIEGWNDGDLCTDDGKSTGTRNNSSRWQAFLRSL